MQAISSILLKKKGDTMGKNIKRILLMIFTVVILLLVPRNADTAYATELGGTGGNGEGVCCI